MLISKKFGMTHVYEALYLKWIGWLMEKIIMRILVVEQTRELAERTQHLNSNAIHN